MVSVCVCEYLVEQRGDEGRLVVERVEEEEARQVGNRVDGSGPEAGGEEHTTDGTSEKAVARVMIQKIDVECANANGFLFVPNPNAVRRHMAKKEGRSYREAMADFDEGDGKDGQVEMSMVQLKVKQRLEEGSGVYMVVESHLEARRGEIVLNLFRRFGIEGAHTGVEGGPSRAGGRTKGGVLILWRANLFVQVGKGVVGTAGHVLSVLLRCTVDNSLKVYTAYYCPDTSKARSNAGKVHDAIYEAISQFNEYAHCVGGDANGRLIRFGGERGHVNDQFVNRMVDECNFTRLGRNADTYFFNRRRGSTMDWSRAFEVAKATERVRGLHPSKIGASIKELCREDRWILCRCAAITDEWEERGEDDGLCFIRVECDGGDVGRREEDRREVELDVVLHEASAPTRLRVGEIRLRWGHLYGSTSGDNGDFKVLPVSFKPDQVAEEAGREVESEEEEPDGESRVVSGSGGSSMIDHVFVNEAYRVQVTWAGMHAPLSGRCNYHKVLCHQIRVIGGRAAGETTVRAKLTDMEDWRRFRSVASEEVRGGLVRDGQSSSKGGGSTIQEWFHWEDDRTLVSQTMDVVQSAIRVTRGQIPTEVEGVLSRRQLDSLVLAFYANGGLSADQIKATLQGEGDTGAETCRTIWKIASERAFAMSGEDRTIRIKRSVTEKLRRRAAALFVLREDALARVGEFRKSNRVTKKMTEYMDQAPPKYKRMLGFTPKRVGDLWKESEDTGVSTQSAVKRAEDEHRAITWEANEADTAFHAKLLSNRGGSITRKMNEAFLGSTFRNFAVEGWRMIREIQTGGSGPGRTGGGVQLPMPMLQDVENGGKMVIPAGEDAGRYRDIVATHYGRLFGRNVLCMKAVNRLVFLVGGSRDASREVEDDGQWMDRCFTLSGLQRQLRK